MAISWGPEVRSSDNAMKVGADLTQSPTSVSGSTTSVEVTAKVYVWAHYPVYDTNNTFKVSGDFSDSKSIPFNTSGGTILVGTYKKTFNTSYSGPITVRLNVSLTGIAPFGSSTAKASVTHKIAQRPANAPNPPSNVTVTRTNDTTHTVRWTNGSTSASTPRTKTKVMRWSERDGAYITIGWPGPSATSFVDKGTRANERYRYRVQAVNDYSVSDLVYSNYFYTSPSAPRVDRATKSGGNVTLSWSRFAYSAAYYEVQDFANGVAQTPTQKTSANAWTHTYTGLDASKAHYFKVRARYDDPTVGSLYSPWTPATSTFQLQAPPLAPSGLTPNGRAQVAGRPILFEWKHEPVDGSSQNAYELEYREVGATEWISTGKVLSEAPSHTLTDAPGSAYEWRVRTWGDHANPSVWSTTAAFPYLPQPVIGLTSPSSSVLNTSTLYLSWDFSDPNSTQLSSEAILRNGDGQELARFAGGSKQYLTAPYKLENGSSYRVSVRARNRYQLWSEWDHYTFTVVYPSPPSPILTAEWANDDGVVTLSASAGIPDETQTDTVSISIYKSENGEDWRLLAEGLDRYVAFLDTTPRINTVVRYRAVAVSDMPSEAYGDPVPVETRGLQSWAFWNWGPGFQRVVKARFDLKPSDRPTREKVLNQFNEREYPLEYTGEGKTHSFTLGFSLDPESSTKEDFTELAWAPAPVCYRLPNGEKHFVSVQSIGFDESKELGDMTREIHVTATMDKVDFHEQ